MPRKRDPIMEKLRRQGCSVDLLWGILEPSQVDEVDREFPAAAETCRQNHELINHSAR